MMINRNVKKVRDNIRGSRRTFLCKRHMTTEQWLRSLLAIKIGTDLNAVKVLTITLIS